MAQMTTKPGGHLLVTAIDDTASTLQAAGSGRGYRIDAEGAAGGHLLPGVIVMDEAQVTSSTNRSNPKPGDPAPTLAATSRPLGIFAIAPEAGQGADLRAFEVDVSPTITATENARMTERGVRVADATGVRRLTPLECERLMGWPDNHTAGVADSHRYRMCGNGVSAPVAEWVARRIDGAA